MERTARRPAEVRIELTPKGFTYAVRLNGHFVYEWTQSQEGYAIVREWTDEQACRAQAQAKHPYCRFLN